MAREARKFKNIQALVIFQITEFIDRRGKITPQGIIDILTNLAIDIEKMDAENEENIAVLLKRIRTNKAEAINTSSLYALLQVCESTIIHANPVRDIEALKKYIIDQLEKFKIENKLPVVGTPEERREGETIAAFLKRLKSPNQYRYIINQIVTEVQDTNQAVGKSIGADELIGLEKRLGTDDALGHVESDDDLLSDEDIIQHDDNLYLKKDSASNQRDLRQDEAEEFSGVESKTYEDILLKLMEEKNNTGRKYFRNDYQGEKTLEGILTMGLQALNSLKKKKGYHQRLVDLLTLLKTNVQNNEEYTERGYPLGYPDDREPDGPVSLFEGNETKNYWTDERWDKIDSFSIVYVSGKYDHTLLKIEMTDGQVFYMHINGIYHYPEPLSEDEFYAYLIRWGKVVDGIQEVDVPNMPAAIAELRSLADKKWWHALAAHNCLTFIKRVLKAGGTDLSKFEYKPPIPKDRLREVEGYLLNRPLLQNLKRADNLYENLLTQFPIQYFKLEEVENIENGERKKMQVLTLDKAFLESQRPRVEAAQNFEHLRKMSDFKKLEALATSWNANAEHLSKEFINYTIRNTHKAYQWQISLQEVLPLREPAAGERVNNRLPEEEAALRLCQFYKHAILSTKWKRGDGLRVNYYTRLNDKGDPTIIQYKIPGNMIRMLNIIRREEIKAEKVKNGQGTIAPNWQNAIDQIAKVGYKESLRNDTIWINWFKRRTDGAKTFYNEIARAYQDAYRLCYDGDHSISRKKLLKSSFSFLVKTNLSQPHVEEQGDARPTAPRLAAYKGLRFR